MAEIVGLTLGIVSLSAKFLDRPRRALLTTLATLEKRNRGDDDHGESPETRRVSGYLAAVVPSFRPQIETINRLLLENDDDQLLKFRESYIFDCNMTAFAVGWPRFPRSTDHILTMNSRAQSWAK